MKISVITTTYNRKDFLLQTIESVQKTILIPLHHVTFEHIIYDDGSTDSTEEIFKNLPYSNVVYIRSDKNNGPSYGRNRAIERATGDYIFLIDSDDILLQRTLHNFAELALQNPNVDWFVTDFLQTNEKLEYLLGRDYYAWKFDNPTQALTSIFKGELFLQSNVLFKKEFFLKIGGFDEQLRISEDLDLFIRFFLVGSIPMYGNFISHFHRHHETNLSSGITLEKHVAHVAIHREKYKDELLKHGII